MEKFVIGTRPYSDAERKRDTQDRREADTRQFARRKARRSGQTYRSPSTPITRRNINRMVGSE
jgi:hypothetical protein